MTENEKSLLDMIKIVSEGSMKADDKILSALEQIAQKSTEVMLQLHDKLVEIDERIARLENKR